MIHEFSLLHLTFINWCSIFDISSHLVFRLPAAVGISYFYLVHGLPAAVGTLYNVLFSNQIQHPSSHLTRFSDFDCPEIGSDWHLFSFEASIPTNIWIFGVEQA